jgi:VCBS repeat-containing protein
VTAKHKSKKCKKGYVKKGKKCVNNAPIPYGRVKITIPSAGKYKLKLKPSAKALAALKQGKTLHVKVTLVFTPAGTTTHILNVKVVRVHLKPKKKHHGKHHK